MNWRWGRRIAYAATGAAVLLLAYWLRDPLIPYGAITPGASGISADSSGISESDARHTEAVKALGNAIRESHRALSELAERALAVPQDPDAAFDFLRDRKMPAETGIIVFKAGTPFAWAGQMRNHMAAILYPCYLIVATSIENSYPAIVRLLFAKFATAASVRKFFSAHTSEPFWDV